MLKIQNRINIQPQTTSFNINKKRPENNNFQTKLGCLETPNSFYSQLQIKNNILSFSGNREKLLIENLAKGLEKVDLPESLKNDFIKFNEEMFEITNEYLSQKPSDLIELYKKHHKETNKGYLESLVDQKRQKENCSTILKLLEPEEKMPRSVDKTSFDRFLESQATGIYCIDQEKFKKLSNNYDIYIFKENLRTTFFKYFRKASNNFALKPVQKEITEIKEILDEKIRCMGIGPEVKAIVKEVKNKYGIDLNIVDSLPLAQAVKNHLELYSPEEISKLNRIDFNNLGEFYGLCGKNIAVYDSVLKTVDYNPYVLLFQSLANIDCVLSHEINGHFIYNVRIGDDKFINAIESPISALLSVDEREILQQTFNSLKEKYPLLKDSSIYEYDKIAKIKEYVDEFAPSPSDHVNYISQEAIPVIEKIDQLYKLIDNNTINAKRAVLAKDNLSELVAVAIQHCEDMEYTPEFKEMLKKLDVNLEEYKLCNKKS